MGLPARPLRRRAAIFSYCAEPELLEGARWLACYLTTGKHMAFYASFGTVLLLLPSQLPLSLFERITASVSSSITTHLNGKVTVTGCHPDCVKAHERTPVPLLRIFLDDPQLLVEGGSMGDAASFL